MQAVRNVWFVTALWATAPVASIVSADDRCYGKTAVCQRQAMTVRAPRAPEPLPAPSAKGFVPHKTAAAQLQQSRPPPRHEGVRPAPVSERCTYKTAVCQRLH